MSFATGLFSFMGGMSRQYREEVDASDAAKTAAATAASAPRARRRVMVMALPLVYYPCNCGVCSCNMGAALRRAKTIAFSDLMESGRRLCFWFEQFPSRQMNPFGWKSLCNTGSPGIGRT